MARYEVPDGCVVQAYRFTLDPTGAPEARPPVALRSGEGRVQLVRLLD